MLGPTVLLALAEEVLGPAGARLAAAMVAGVLISANSPKLISDCVSAGEVEA